MPKAQSPLSSKRGSLITRLFAHHWVQVIAVFSVVNVARLHPIFFFGKTLFFGDNYSLLVPGRLFLVQWLKQGIVPLWNPNLFSGISVIGDISHSLFYPTTVAFLLFHPAVALSLTALAHLFLTMSGMYLLAKWFSKNHYSSLMVSVLWMVSSQVTGSLNNLQTLQSLAWLPLVLFSALAVHRSFKGGLLFVAVIVGNFLAGYPQHVLAAVPIAAVFSLFAVSQEHKLSWRVLVPWVGRWLIVGLLSLGFSAFALLPFIETLAGSTRLAQSADQAARGSMHPLEIIKLWVPYFFDAPSLGLRWGPSWNVFPTAVPYVTAFGWLTFLLTLKLKKLDKVQLFLIGMSGVTLFLSLGSFIPGYTWVLEHIPFSTTVRYPSSWLVLTNISWLLLLAYQLPTLKISKLWRSWIGWLTGVGAVLMAISYWIVRSNFDLVWKFLNSVTGQALLNSPFHTWERDQLILSVITANLAVNLCLFGVAIWAWSRKRLWLVLAIVLLDASLNSQLILLWAPNRVYDQPQAQQLIDSVRSPQFRVMTRNFNRSYTDFGSYWEALVVRPPFSDSFIDDSELQQAQHLQRLRDGLTPDWNEVVNVPIVNGYTTLLPRDYQLLWEKDGEARINSLSYIPMDHELLKHWAVKYYIVDEWFQIDEDFSAYPQVYHQAPWSVYELEALSRFRMDNDQAVELTSLEEDPNTIELQFTNTSTSGYLKIADRYEQGWTAMVNQQPVRVENRSGMRAIPVPPGKNVVVLTYRPVSFYTGLAVTGATLAVVAIGVGFKRWRQQRVKLKN